MSHRRLIYLAAILILLTFMLSGYFVFSSNEPLLYSTSNRLEEQQQQQQQQKQQHINTTNASTCETFSLSGTNQQQLQYCGITNYWKPRIDNNGRILICLIPGLLALAMLLIPIRSGDSPIMRWSMETLILVALIMWEAWSFGFDLVLFVGVESGYVIDPRIMRDSKLQILILVFAMLSMMKGFVLISTRTSGASDGDDEDEQDQMMIKYNKHYLRRRHSSLSPHEIYIILGTVIQIPSTFVIYFYVEKFAYEEVKSRMLLKDSLATMFALLFVFYFMLLVTKKQHPDKLSNPPGNYSLKNFVYLISCLLILFTLATRTLVFGARFGEFFEVTCLHVFEGSLMQTPFHKSCFEFTEQIFFVLCMLTSLSSLIILWTIKKANQNSIKQNTELKNIDYYQDEVWTSRNKVIKLQHI